MKRFLVAITALACGFAAASCGQKASDTSSPPAGGTGTTSSGSTVAAVSKYDSGPRAGETPANAEMAKKGAELLKTKGCTACHAFGKRLTCPDLQGASMRRTAEWLENQILHPDVMVKEDPIAHDLFAKFALQMPKQGLTLEEARAVIEHIKQMDQDAGLTKAASK